MILFFLKKYASGSSHDFVLPKRISLLLLEYFRLISDFHKLNKHLKMSLMEILKYTPK